MGRRINANQCERAMTGPRECHDRLNKTVISASEVPQLSSPITSSIFDMSNTERTDFDEQVADNGFVVNDHSEFEDQSENDDADADTASQRSISLSSPPRSPGHDPDTSLRAQDLFARRGSQDDSLEIDFNSETDDVSDSFSERNARRASSITSAAPSAALFDEPKYNTPYAVTYPPTPSSRATDTDSFTSAASSYSKKARPESMLLQPPEGPLVLGIALVDFNHLV